MIHLQVQYINELNELMIIGLCDKGKFWFYHSNCNDDHELIKVPFKYILHEPEKVILKNFLIRFGLYRYKITKKEKEMYNKLIDELQ